MGAPGQGYEDSAVPPVLSGPCRLPRWLVAKAAGLRCQGPWSCGAPRAHSSFLGVWLWWRVAFVGLNGKPDAYPRPHSLKQSKKTLVFIFLYTSSLFSEFDSTLVLNCSYWKCMVLEGKRVGKWKTCVRLLILAFWIYFMVKKELR